MIRRFFILFALLSLVACSSPLVKELVQTPEIKSIQLSHFSVQDKQAVFNVSLYNPNPYPLPISSLAGDITLNGLTIGNLAAKSDKQLAAFDTQTVVLPLALDPDALVNAAQSVFLQRKAEYRFDGHVETSIGKVPVIKEGESSVQDILRSAF